MTPRTHPTNSCMAYRSSRPLCNFFLDSEVPTVIHPPHPARPWGGIGRAATVEPALASPREVEMSRPPHSAAHRAAPSVPVPFAMATRAAFRPGGRTIAAMVATLLATTSAAGFAQDA